MINIFIQRCRIELISGEALECDFIVDLKKISMNIMYASLGKLVMITGFGDINEEGIKSLFKVRAK